MAKKILIKEDKLVDLIYNIVESSISKMGNKKDVVKESVNKPESLKKKTVKKEVVKETTTKNNVIKISEKNLLGLIEKVVKKSLNKK